MENAGYTTLTRQAGLIRELQVVANNIANASTAGYRQEGLVFGEYVKRTEGGTSISMATANIRNTSMVQGGLSPTGNQFDLAIEGDGFFMIETPAGERITRAGSFSVSGAGELVTPDGFRVLDLGGAPLFIPPDAPEIGVSPDGTISAGDRLVGQLALVRPIEAYGLIREDGVMFRSETGTEPAFDARVIQGFVEGSNVDPISQIARMVEIQRAYEMGQSFLESENERIRNAMKTFIK